MKKIIAIILIFITAEAGFAQEYENLQLNAAITKSAIRGNVAVYNLSNAKLHSPDCEWAEKCTKNCIYLDKKEIKKMFYVPCMVCGGGIFEPVEEDKEEE